MFSSVVINQLQDWVIIYQFHILVNAGTHDVSSPRNDDHLMTD